MQPVTASRLARATRHAPQRPASYRSRPLATLSPRIRLWAFSSRRLPRFTLASRHSACQQMLGEVRGCGVSASPPWKATRGARFGYCLTTTCRAIGSRLTTLRPVVKSRPHHGEGALLHTMGHWTSHLLPFRLSAESPCFRSHLPNRGRRRSSLLLGGKLHRGSVLILRW